MNRIVIVKKSKERKKQKKTERLVCKPTLEEDQRTGAACSNKHFSLLPARPRRIARGPSLEHSTSRNPARTRAMLQLTGQVQSSTQELQRLPSPEPAQESVGMRVSI